MTFFPGVDPSSDLMPSIDKFLMMVRSIPAPIRLQKITTSLQKMLSEQLIYTYQLLGSGVFRDTLSKIKKEIADPLAKHRDIVRRYEIEDNFYTTLKQADKVVKLVRG